MKKYSDKDIDFFKYLVNHKGNCDDYKMVCEDCPVRGKVNPPKYSEEAYEKILLKIARVVLKNIKLEKVREILK